MAARPLQQKLGASFIGTSFCGVMVKCGEPPRKAIQQQPRTPGKAGETLRPDNPIASEHEHKAHSEDPVKQNPVCAISPLLDRLSDAVTSDCHNSEGREGEDES